MRVATRRYVMFTLAATASMALLAPTPAAAQVIQAEVGVSGMF